VLGMWGRFERALLVALVQAVCWNGGVQLGIHGSMVPPHPAPPSALPATTSAAGVTRGQVRQGGSLCLGRIGTQGLPTPVSTHQHTTTCASPPAPPCCPYDPSPPPPPPTHPLTHPPHTSCSAAGWWPARGHPWTPRTSSCTSSSWPRSRPHSWRSSRRSTGRSRRSSSS
jgi:hypothetical protein